jgi:diguanylate cyclase (GGDEF)-like protein
MSQAIDHLAELTGLRDRDVLDVTLAQALMSLLRPRGVAVRRVVGPAQDQRWFTRAELAAGQATPRADSMWAELDSLLPLAARPEALACLHGQFQTTSPGSATAGGAGAGAVAQRLCFPLGGERGAVAVVELEIGHALAADELRLVQGMLRVYRNFQGLLDSSERDTLTGLLNRSTFDGSFMRLAGGQGDQGGLAAGTGPGDGGLRQGNPALACLGVIDIDHFKRVNDGFGHLIGDEVLLLNARLMRSTFRFHDLLFRFGGEEFVVLMRVHTLADACRAFERYRAEVERYAFPQVGRITVSVGLTALGPNDTPQGAFERADKAVYWVKQNGRNQVAEHGALVDRGLLEAADRTGDVELF